ncbi:GNAT family N-acetyltransferase [Saprospiraceae bacterium]|nr:GNAT family N-acetyltransferase [Saprospiraceae bacterium]MDG1432828.1 GNAT family N-acetyltransferase [Saprospiraceae bacterium]
MNISVRKANANDLNAIYNLVVELAVYEKEPDAVTATLADYEKNFSSLVFQSLVAEQNGRIIGTCVYYLTWSTWKGRMIYLEDFVVTESHRKKGIGQLLFDRFLTEAKNMNATSVKWQVLNWNEPAIQFYEKNNAIIEKEWWNGKLIFS